MFPLDIHLKLRTINLTTVFFMMFPSVKDHSSSLRIFVMNWVKWYLFGVLYYMESGDILRCPFT